MSVLVISKFDGDVARFRQALADHGDDFAKMAENARTSGGGIHHRFAVGDDFVVVVDEWETAGHFEKFSRTRTCKPSSHRPVPPQGRRRSPSLRQSPHRTSTKPGHNRTGASHER